MGHGLILPGSPHRWWHMSCSVFPKFSSALMAIAPGKRGEYSKRKKGKHPERERTQAHMKNMRGMAGEVRPRPPTRPGGGGRGARTGRNEENDSSDGGDKDKRQQEGEKNHEAGGKLYEKLCWRTAGRREKEG